MNLGNENAPDGGGTALGGRRAVREERPFRACPPPPPQGRGLKPRRADAGGGRDSGPPGKCRLRGTSQRECG